MSGNDKDKRIERMFKDKQYRIAKQIALREARETVALSSATSLKDPAIVAAKVIEIAEEYLKWISK